MERTIYGRGHSSSRPPRWWTLVSGRRNYWGRTALHWGADPFSWLALSIWKETSVQPAAIEVGPSERCPMSYGALRQSDWRRPTRWLRSWIAHRPNRSNLTRRTDVRKVLEVPPNAVHEGTVRHPEVAPVDGPAGYTRPGASNPLYIVTVGGPVTPTSSVTFWTLGLPSKKLWNCSAVSHSSMTTSSPSPATKV
jgi:hypothetical protein